MTKLNSFARFAYCAQNLPGESAPFLMIDIFKTYSIELGCTGHLKIGPLSLWLVNQPFEWRVSWGHAGGPIHDAIQELIVQPEEGDIPGREWRRFGYADKSNSLQISPKLSDRSMVVRPDKPLLIPGGERVTFFLSTPLWLILEDGQRQSFLTEIPTHRPSDTWFGESSIEGELCYYTKTAARLLMAELPLRYHRAVSTVSLNNRDNKPLLVDRIKIPMKNLSLYRSEVGWFYTDSLSFEWEGNKDEIKMGLRGKPDLGGEFLALAAEPREPLESNLVVRTVKSLFGS